MLDESKKWKVEVIDIDEMTRTVVADGVTGKVRVDLPGKVGIAILTMEKSE